MPHIKPIYLLLKRSYQLVILLVILLALPAKATDYPELNATQFNWLGEQIYRNECNQQSDCLTAWNSGEEFPSLGIGHFIWYQSEQEEIFEESFPLLLEFFQGQGIEIPQWIVEESYNSPWQQRQHFLDDFNKPQLTELRFFLQEHIAQQTQFIVQRFEQALDKIIAGNAKSDSAMLEERFILVANASPPYGLYALIDYINFKGEGISSHERYNGQGWGLSQVLSNMSDLDSNQATVLERFVLSAQQTLTKRVQSSPVDRNEERWLNGWNKRLNTYLPAIQE